MLCRSPPASGVTPQRCHFPLETLTVDCGTHMRQGMLHPPSRSQSDLRCACRCSSRHRVAVRATVSERSTSDVHRASKAGKLTVVRDCLSQQNVSVDIRASHPLPLLSLATVDAGRPSQLDLSETEAVLCCAYQRMATAARRSCGPRPNSGWMWWPSC